MAKRTEWPKIAVYLLLEKAEKVMLIRRYNTGWHDGDFSLPAGHVKSGEPAIQSMIREAKEEVGVIVRKEDLELAHVIHRNKTLDNPEYVDLYFRAKRWKGKIKMGPSCDKIQWSGLNNLPGNIIPVVEFVLKQISNGKLYSDQGWRE